MYIAADVEQVFQTCVDFENYQEWAGTGIKSAEKVRDVPQGSLLLFHTGAFGIGFFFSMITKSHFLDRVDGQEIKSLSFKLPRCAPMVRSLRGNCTLDHTLCGGC